MASGGRRFGAGRPRGSKNKSTIERQRIAEELLSNGDRGGSGNLNSSDKWNFGLYLA